MAKKKKKVEQSIPNKPEKEIPDWVKKRMEKQKEDYTQPTYTPKPNIFQKGIGKVKRDPMKIAKRVNDGV